MSTILGVGIGAAIRVSRMPSPSIIACRETEALVSGHAFLAERAMNLGKGSVCVVKLSNEISSAHALLAFFRSLKDMACIQPLRKYYMAFPNIPALDLQARSSAFKLRLRLNLLFWYSFACKVSYQEDTSEDSRLCR